MAQLGNHFSHFETGKLATFAWLCALGDLDFNLFGGPQIFGCNAKAPTRDLLDRAVGIVAIGIGFEASAIFAAFARNRFRPDPVHRYGKRFMRLGAKRTKRHARRYETFADFGDRLNRFKTDRLFGEVEFEQIAQIDRRQIAHPARKLQIG